uniref:Uncharacterized protein n=1 Tax=Candidatus Kentrum sp. TUN TaxID=2126343 RepID=A0A450ZZ18_9GAMM|nr:MAG: hypothetical protein BECKTUN1418D_GA0071000_10946 [Candidatus Kentron sp. TUN]
MFPRRRGQEREKGGVPIGLDATGPVGKLRNLVIGIVGQRQADVPTDACVVTNVNESTIEIVLEIELIAIGVPDCGKSRFGTGNFYVGTLGIEEISGAVAERQGMLTDCRRIECQGIEVALGRGDDPSSVLIVHQIVDFTATLIDIG